MDLSYHKQRNLFGADMLFNEILRETDLCFILKEHVAPRIDLCEFEDMYKEGGRRPISPKMLVLVTVLQYLEGLSDRDAVTCLRFRMDWKIALGLELEDEGIHPTTLVKFRNRLVEHEKSNLVFEKVLDQLKSLGLIQKGSKQRIDSTHVIGKVQRIDPTRAFA